MTRMKEATSEKTVMLSAAGLAAMAVFAVLLSGCAPSPHWTYPQTTQEFDAEITRSDQPVMVEFYKPGCPACIRLAGTIEGVARDYGDRAHFVMMSQEESRPVRSRYGFYSFPTVVLFINGRPRAHWVNAHSRKTYTEALDAALAEMQGS